MEIDERAIVMGAGIDKGSDGKINLTAQILLPQQIGVPAGGGSSPKSAVWVATGTGLTVGDAERNLTSKVGRELFWQYNEIVVIGEKAAREGIKPIVEFYTRCHELRPRQLALVAHGKAADILKAKHKLEAVPATAIEGQVKNYKLLGTTVEATIFDLKGMLISKSSAPVVSRIGLINAVNEAGAAGEGGKAEEQEKKNLLVTGAAVFRADKLAGFLNKHETRGLNWVLGDVVSGALILVKSPLSPQEKAGIEVIRAKSRVSPKIKAGVLSLNITVEMEGKLSEQTSRADLTKPESWSSLERRTATAIRNEIKAALLKAQKEYRADIFRFGEAVHRRYPREWKELKADWEERFSRLTTNLDIRVNLRRPGVIKKPVLQE